MTSLTVADQQIWFIAHNGWDTFHVGTATAGQEVSTGQPTLETFTTQEAFDARCTELGCTLEPLPEE